MNAPFGTTLVAGDSWNFAVPFVDDYDSTTWALKFYLRGPGANIDATATVDGEYKFAIAAATTADLNAGTYSYQFRLDNGTAKVEVLRGTVDILPNLEKATEGFDGRSHAKKMLDAIRNVLEGVATREEQEYTVQSPGGGGRTLRLMSRKDLRDLEAEYAARYRREQVDAGQLSQNSNQVRVRFV